MKTSFIVLTIRPAMLSMHFVDWRDSNHANSSGHRHGVPLFPMGRSLVSLQASFMIPSVRPWSSYIAKISISANMIHH